MLVVEEDPEMAHVIATHFATLGYDVHRSPDGLDALQRIAVEPPDVVVMNLTAPRVGGVEMVRLLRRRHPDLGVVLSDDTKRRDGESWHALDRAVAGATAAPARAKTPLPESTQRVPAMNPAPPRVLVVDDVEEIRELLRDILEADGYVVDLAADAPTALATLARARPEVMLLDISLPGLSGLSALRQVRARDPHVGVIMVTGNGDEGIARQALALGAFDYVRKPIDFEYLGRSIRKALAMRRFVPPDPGSNPAGPSDQSRSLPA